MLLLQVAQLQKQKKKANKKASTATDTSKDADTTKEAEAAPESAASTETAPPADTPADEKPEEDATADTATPEQPAESESQEKPSVSPQPIESPVEPMPPAPTSPDPETESQPARLDTPRAGHTRQPSLSIQSKMRSSSFRKTSISQGSAPSPAALKSPPQPLPPLTGDGESVHEVFRKQSTKIEELEKDNKRLEKELSDATTRWRKTEDQLEDLREASVDGAELREQLKQAEEKVASIEALVCRLGDEFSRMTLLMWITERGDCFVATAKLTASVPVTSQQRKHLCARDVRIATSRSCAPVRVQVRHYRGYGTRNLQSACPDHVADILE